MLLSSPNVPKFIKIKGLDRNVSNMSGVFSAQEMEDSKRRKNGEYQCKYKTWHDKFQKCDCAEYEKLKNSRV